MHIGKKADFEQDRNYEDLDGNIKTFTIRDYSKKTKVAMAQTKADYKEVFREYREELLQRLYKVDAIHGLPEYDKFVLETQRDEYEWDLAMTKDEGVDLNELTRLVVHCEKKQEFGEGDK